MARKPWKIKIPSSILAQAMALRTLERTRMKVRKTKRDADWRDDLVIELEIDDEPGAKLDRGLVAKLILLSGLDDLIDQYERLEKASRQRPDKDSRRDH